MPSNQQLKNVPAGLQFHWFFNLIKLLSKMYAFTLECTEEYRSWNITTKKSKMLLKKQNAISSSHQQ